MANASTTGFGLKAAMRLGNTPAISGQSKYDIKDNTGVGLFKGNPVSLEDSSGDQGFLQDASFSTTDDGGGGGVDFASGTEALLVGVFNGAFYVLANIIKNVMTSAMEAEIDALYENAKKVIEFRQVLTDMGHPQPPTLIRTDNKTACGILHGTMKQKRSKAINMRY